MHVGSAFSRPDTGEPNGVQYLRVSDVSQVKTDYDPEGNSIPAQRAKNDVRAAELSITFPPGVEFIDPGKSAKTIEGREAFKEMIAYLKTHRNIKFVVVYALSRTARNRYDDAVLMMTLEKLGVTLISATERNLDDSPAGKAMHGFIAVMNQYRSDLDGEDIKYKMGQKVIAKGGSIGVARVGYLNVRDTSEGREIRTIGVDEKRKPYVIESFKLFATGDYTTDTLHELMVDRGFTMRPTYKKPERPISRATFAAMLRDRYYIGEVNYKGVWHPGRHDALIEPWLFDRVQEILDSHSGSGVRTQKHHHHLKGAFWCKRCGHRYRLQKANGNGGQYWYFFCSGTSYKVCNQPFVPLEDIERETDAYFAKVKLTKEFREAVADMVNATMLDELAVQEAQKKRVDTRLKELDQQENQYLALLGNPDWPQEKLTAKMAELRVERMRLHEQLNETAENLEVGRSVLLGALALLENPQELYRQSDDAGKRLLTATLFDKLYIDTYNVVDHELNEPFGALAAVQQRHTVKPVRSGKGASPKGYMRRVSTSPAYASLSARVEAALAARNNKGTILADSAFEQFTTGELLDLALLDQGLCNGVLVDDTGIEPVTSSVSGGVM